jgi:hypothetical protein
MSDDDITFYEITLKGLLALADECVPYYYGISEECPKCRIYDHRKKDRTGKMLAAKTTNMKKWENYFIDKGWEICENITNERRSGVKEKPGWVYALVNSKNVQECDDGKWISKGKKCYNKYVFAVEEDAYYGSIK